MAQPTVCLVDKRCFFCHCRVIAPGESKTIGSHVFTNWGSHHDCYPTAYFTVAAAIGMKRGEVDVFLERLDRVFVKFRKKYAEDNLST